MKPLLILILLLCIACNNITEQGFTNKSEARNEMINGLKEGKWCEYDINKDTNNQLYPRGDTIGYVLEIYRAGKLNGIMRRYDKIGELNWEKPYVDGYETGIEIWYYRNGIIANEIPLSHDTIIGVWKKYFINGKLKGTTPYVHGMKNGLSKDYYENGNLESETIYCNDTAKETVNYDENGKDLETK